MAETIVAEVPVSINSRAGRPSNAIPVTMQGGTGSDCLYTPDTTPVLSYE